MIYLPACKLFYLWILITPTFVQVWVSIFPVGHIFVPWVCDSSKGWALTVTVLSFHSTFCWSGLWVLCPWGSPIWVMCPWGSHTWVLCLWGSCIPVLCSWRLRIRVMNPQGSYVWVLCPRGFCLRELWLWLKRIWHINYVALFFQHLFPWLRT